MQRTYGTFTRKYFAACWPYVAVCDRMWSATYGQFFFNQTNFKIGAVGWTICLSKSAGRSIAETTSDDDAADGEA